MKKKNGALIILLGIITLPLKTLAYDHGILMIGDSWADIMFNKNSVRNALWKKGILNTDVKSKAIGGTTAEIWAQDIGKNLVSSTLVGNPHLNRVHVSLGGNDLFARWRADMDYTQRHALWQSIASNVESIVDHSLLHNAGFMKVAIVGYDYINLIETGNAGIQMWILLGYPTPSQLNNAMIELEREKAKIADKDFRITYINNMGLQQYKWSGIGFGPGDIYASSPGGTPELPSPKSAMGNNANDAIHYNETGYRYIAEREISILQNLDWF